MNFEDFCGGPIWDPKLTWETDQPDFTDCFLKTITPWVPCFFLLLVSPFYYFLYLRKLPTLPPDPSSKLHVAKFATNGVLMLLHVIAFVHHALAFRMGRPSYVPADLLVPALSMLTFSVSMLLMVVERRKRLVTSSVHFIFFFILLISALPTIISLVSRKLKGQEDMDVFRLITWVLCTFLSLLQLVLFSLSDSAHYNSIPPSSFTHENRPPCPENRASFPSRVFFNWIRNLVYIGYKRTLTEKDLFDLNPRDRTVDNASKLEKAWKEEVEACKRHNQGLLQQDDLDDETQTFFTPQPKHGTFANEIHNFQDLFNNENLDPISPKPPIPPTTPISVPHRSGVKNPSLFKVLGKIFGLRLLWSHFLKIFCDILLLSGPLIQSLLIDFIEQTTSLHAWQGYLYAVLFFFNSLCYTILFQWVFHIGMNVGMRINSSVIALVYKKALTMDSEARRSSTVGEVVNLMSVDAQRMQDATAYLWMLWSSPLQIVLSLGLLWKYLGPSVLAGMAVMVFMIPLNVLVATIQKRLQISQMKKKDERIKVMNELLNGIKVLKLYAWETSMRQRVEEIRGMELSILSKFCYLAAVITFSWSSAPFLVTLATFGTFISTGGVLDAKKAFTALSLFNILRVPISLLPMVVTFIVMAVVSTQRICAFLQTSDLNQNNVLRVKSKEAIRVEDGTFAWSKSPDQMAILNRINLNIKKGSLTAVVGQVGAGKSSLVAAMLGEMEKKSGTVMVDGSVAYVSQQAWIQNATLRDNILFGLPYDHQKYQKVLEVCAMTRDLEILQGGDMIEIGEKGINLSGGQKQRVSLARAIYQDSDIYLLDDPLSAVDSHVAKHIFKQVIGPQGVLKDKTRLLVTHGITWLPRCDVIVVMRQGGEMAECGSYEELLDTSVDFAKFIREFLLENADDYDGGGDGGDGAGGDDDVCERFVSGGSLLSDTGNEADDDKDDDDVDDEDYLGLSPRLLLHEAMSSFQKKKEVKKMLLERVTSLISDDDDVALRGRKSMAVSLKMLQPPPLEPESELIRRRKDELKGERSKIITEENTMTGQVKFSVYWVYMKSLGLLFSFLFIIAFILFQVSSLLSNFWLSLWTNNPLIANTTTASRNLSVNYYSVQAGYMAGYAGFGVLQAFFILIYALVSAQANVNSSRTLHKGLLATILRAPMSFFDTTPIGRILNRFSKDIEMVDSNLIPAIKSWLGNLCNILSTVVVISYSTPIFLVVVIPVLIVYALLQHLYMPTTRQLKRLESTTKSPIYNHFSESISGASVIRSFNKQQQFIHRSQYLVDHNMSIYFANISSNRWLSIILDTMGGVVILSAAVFAVMARNTLSPSLVGLSISYALQITVSLTWLVRMSTQLETNVVSVERILEYSNTPSEADWYEGTAHPPADWPRDGGVEFKEYGLRYRDNLDLVLKDINIKVKPGEKIGIVGRTGAGKSSVTLALFRIVEPALGAIHIDGVNISKLGLYKLRSSITILPQDPVLFSGSLRSNLDPTDKHTDDEVWSALDHAHLKSFVSRLPGQLYYECGEGGENLSVGQRQLMCLGRTLLRRTKVLVLDEATAAVDLETDKVIQETIREEFKDSTVLTIAHRINTILSCDRVMVMDGGAVVEFDDPNTLLNQPTSYFYALAKDAGIIS